jgi:hypothetical protein
VRWPKPALDADRMLLATQSALDADGALLSRLTNVLEWTR